MAEKADLTQSLIDYAAVFGDDISAELFRQVAYCTDEEIAEHFESWNALRQSAGLDPQFETTRRPSNHHTRAEILELLRQAVAVHGENISLQKFQTVTGLSERLIVSRFERWSELRLAAGLTPYAHVRLRHSDEELLADVHRIAQELGRAPRRIDYQKKGGKFSGPTFLRRFGSWEGVLAAYESFAASRS
ncbi:homing endonuclease associated repeat-containing protein [Planctomicrobium piriforme]|uniref:homing endonuclease associated repeat-containing protein n=1 Tax=Planctomicrobium piriforme TaxID=1576369 RepID=UPI0011134EF7|nr:hypothetical protein [Planctomicrobium piriforme]